MLVREVRRCTPQSIRGYRTEAGLRHPVRSVTAAAIWRCGTPGEARFAAAKIVVGSGWKKAA